MAKLVKLQVVNKKSLFLQSEITKIMTEEHVSHPGVISEVANEEIKVKILSSGACGGCNMKSACNIAEMEEKELIIPVKESKEYSVGQPVNIRMSVRQGNKAVVFAYLVPVIILIVMILTFSSTDMKDIYSALISISVVGIYYFILYLFRDKIKKQFSYEVLPQGVK